MQTLAVLRIMWVLVMLAWALLAVFRMPTGILFYATVAATEAGYVLVLLTLPAFVGGLSMPRDIVLSAIGAATLVLLLSPLARVGDVARTLPSELTRAFGASPTLADAQPFRWSRLLAFGDPEVPCETLTYVTRDGGALRLDFYGGREARTPRPLVLVIHGGSWRSGDRHQLPSMAKRMAHAGYAVAAMDYRLAPTHPFPAAYDDVRAAVDYLREHAAELGIDAERVVLYGRSAGGHLALLAAYRWQAPFVRGVVALYPPTDLEYSWHHPSEPTRAGHATGPCGEFLGGGPDESSRAARALRRRLALCLAASADSPPTLLIHGGRDELVRPRAQRAAWPSASSALQVPHHVLAPALGHARLRGEPGGTERSAHRVRRAPLPRARVRSPLAPHSKMMTESMGRRKIRKSPRAHAVRGRTRLTSVAVVLVEPHPAGLLVERVAGAALGVRVVLGLTQVSRTSSGSID